MPTTTPLVQKFSITRNQKPYPPHEGEHFVLLPKNDPHARRALITYANSVREENVDLSDQILIWLASL